MRASWALGTFTLLFSLSACGLIDRIRGSGDEADEEASEAGEKVGEAAEDEGLSGVLHEAESASKAASVDRFKQWSPGHAFLTAPTIAAEVISEQEQIVATRDAHVGVSQDGGKTWRWTKANDAVRRVTGYVGGPYVALHDGALSLSDDAQSWRRLPRYGADTLVDVVAAELGLVALGKNGSFVHFDKAGEVGHFGELPGKFKATAVTELNGAVLAWAGKRGYGTTDGRTWTELEILPPMPDGRSFMTSAGSCTIGKVGKRRGAVCSVTGTAYGIEDEFAVENKGVVSLTRDGGETWQTAGLPPSFKAANAIFGASGGPYYAIGNNGAVAISKDGASWVDQKWEDRANLLAGMVDGQTVIIVGAAGTLIYSTNGGGKWEYAQPPSTKSLTWVGKVGGLYVAGDGRSFIASQDGVDWTEADAVPLPGKPGNCDGKGPDDGERCRWSTSVTSPEGIPEVRGLAFEGDLGLAFGDAALVAVTNDGGMTWTVAHGLELGRNGATSFSVRGDRLLASDGARLWFSTDAGATWAEGQTARKYAINAVHVAESGVSYAAARDEVLAAKVDPKIWLPAADEPLKGDWRALFEVAGVVYVAGSKGELLRSEDGNSWARVETGFASPVVALAGEGEVVWAVTAYSRNLNNMLLRSEDGGAHFIVVGEAPSSSDEPDLRVAAGAVHLGDLVSRDNGQTWRREVQRYFPGLVDTHDGSGLQITNLVYRYARDRLYVVTGPGEYDWVRIDSAFTEGGSIRCDPSSGCWMLASGVLYRPLGR
jgi:photosystem II stability/assembly factor-like uncharacterized protein